MSSWAMYEPMDSLQPVQGQMPGQMQMPQMQHKNEHVATNLQQIPHQLPSPLSSASYPEGSKNVPVQEAVEKKTEWKDISDYHDLSDWLYYLVAAIVIEVIVITITRYAPSFSGKYLNLWYSRFKWSAIGLDIISVLIGFGIARYIFTEAIYPKTDWNPLYFTGTAVGVQIVHDILFYFGVVRPMPQGTNSIIDLFKSYGEAGGLRVVAGDSAIMIGTSVGAMLLKAIPLHGVVATGLVFAYALPYILETRNDYSSLS